MRRFAPLLTAALLTAALASLMMGSLLLMAIMGVLVVGAAWPLLFQRVAGAEVGWFSPGKLATVPAGSPAPPRMRSTRASSIIRALGRVEARELASSIWFGVGIGFSVMLNVLFAVVWGKDETHLWPDDAMLAPWYVHPLVGMTVLAVHRNVTRARRDGTDELFDTCPTSPETRTWGFLATAWLPTVVGGAFYLSYLAILAGRGVDFDGPFGAAQVFDIASAAVLCIGGVALGVALGRWVRFGLAPVIAVIAVGIVSLGIATTGDPHWNPIAELSTLPPIETIEQLYLARNNGGHVMWLLALTGLVVVIALTRDRRDRSLAAIAVALLAGAAAGGALATRPISGAEAARIADHVIDPAAHQTCVSGAGGRLEVCTFEHYRDIGREVVAPVSAIVEALPRDISVTMRQRYLEGAVLADLPPGLRHHFPDGLPARPSSEASLAFGFDKYEVDRARFEVAFLATGLPRASPPDDEPAVIAGEARGVVALWLATRGMDPADAMATATAFDPQSSDPFARGLTWYEECTTPLVVWSAQDLEAARALMAAPDSDVIGALAADWDRWTDPGTGTDELLDAVGLATVGPVDRFATRAESLGC